MSPSWLDHLTLLVHPRRICLVRRNWRGQSSVFSAPFAAQGSVESGPLLEAVDLLLGREAARWSRLEIVMADPLVRYAVLPWSDAVIRPSDREALARALLRHSQGERVARLDIALDQAVWGKPGLAAAVDRDLLTGLRALSRKYGLRLTHLRPRLVVELAAHRNRLDEAWLLCAEEGWLTLVEVAQGQLLSVRNHRASDVAEALAGVLAAEASNETKKKVIVAQAGAASLNVPGWPLETVMAAVEYRAHA